jgi:hypothetical protein
VDKEKPNFQKKKKVLQSKENFGPGIRWKVLAASRDEGGKGN